MLQTTKAAAAAILMSGLLVASADAAKAPPLAALSEQERSDVAAVMAAAKPDTPTELDMANPAHRRFFEHLLRAAGFTPERYPQTFRAIEAAARTPPPPLDRRPLAVRGPGGPGVTIQPIQTLTSVGTTDGVNYAASALSSLPGSPYYSSLVVQLYDQNGNPIGQPASVTSATRPASDLDAVATGVSQTRNARVKSLAAYFWQDQYGRAYHGVIQAEVTSAPTSITNLAPTPGPNQTITKLCLGRTGTDCTYTPSGGSGSNVLMPVQGSITFSSPISTDSSTQSSLITMARPDNGQGGGCTIASTSNFFGDPNTHITGNAISWNLAPAQFQPANGCLNPNTTAIYTFTLGLSVANQPTFVTITSDPTTDPTNPYFKKIAELQVFFSCLAEGTRVALADGSTATIEALKEGDKLLVDAGGRAEAVDSKLKGLEQVPMVRLKTAKGHELLLTDGHPVVTPDGPVLAGLLRAGQQVLTREGPDALAVVGREMFAKPVWNLNVGAPPASLNDPAATGATFFAEGIQVGDNVMQFVENRKHQRELATQAARQAPAEWRQDLQSAIEDEAK